MSLFDRNALAAFLMSEKDTRPHDSTYRRVGGLFGVLPLAENGYTGKPEVAVPGLPKAAYDLITHMPQSIYNGITAPANAWAGNLPQWQSDGDGNARTSDLMGGAAMDVAGAAMTGGIAMPKPSNTLGIFGGRLAKTADQAALARAEADLAAGVPREKVWQDHGWFKGVDGKMRFEIDDSRFTPVRGQMSDAIDTGSIRPVSQNFNHPDLFAAYPDAANIPLRYGSQTTHSPTSGITSRMLTSKEVGHELQHAIQNTEDFARGANASRVGLNDYMNTAGEVEARAVERRLKMTPDERRARAPWLDYDVPEANQIYSNPKEGMAANSLMQGAKNESQGIRAYHGSPHDFDAFSLDKIGTGEGAQAYGHGLYFAEDPKVAGFYKKAVSRQHSAPVFTSTQLQDINQASAWLTGGRQGDISARARQYVDDAIADLGATASDVELAAHLSGSNQAGVLPGRMYEVNIKADPNDFLDWDKPLSQQTTAKAFAERDLQGYGSGGRDPLGMTGAEFYRGLDNAPQTLREAGIPGIKYLDQGSRTAGEGSRNYVVFDEKLIEIARKYGIPLGALGLGAGGLFDTKNEQ